MPKTKARSRSKFPMTERAAIMDHDQSRQTDRSIAGVPLDQMPPVLTVNEVCDYLRLDRRTVYALIDDRSLESNGRSGKGRPIRVWTASVLDYVRGKRRAS